MLVSLRLITCCVLERGILAAKELTTVFATDASIAAAAVDESINVDATKKDEAGEEELALIPTAAVIEGSIDGGNLVGSLATKKE